MAATADLALSAQRPATAASTAGQHPVSVLLFVANTDNPTAQQRALDALNRHSSVARARLVTDATRQIRLEYWAGYTSLEEVIRTTRCCSGVELRQIG